MQNLLVQPVLSTSFSNADILLELEVHDHSLAFCNWVLKIGVVVDVCVLEYCFISVTVRKLLPRKMSVGQYWLWITAFWCNVPSSLCTFQPKEYLN